MRHTGDSGLPDLRGRQRQRPVPRDAVRVLDLRPLSVPGAGWATRRRPRVHGLMVCAVQLAIFVLACNGGLGASHWATVLVPTLGLLVSSTVLKRLRLYRTIPCRRASWLRALRGLTVYECHLCLDRSHAPTTWRRAPAALLRRLRSRRPSTTGFVCRFPSRPARRIAALTACAAASWVS